MKTVVVTGGTRGLGRALCLSLGRRGFHFVAVYHRDEEAAASLREEARSLGLAGSVVRGDLASAELGAEIAALPEVIDAKKLVLVNNACAPFAPQPFHLVTDATLDNLMDTVVRGPFRLTRGLLRPLVRTGGVVVNVLSSVVGAEPGNGFSAYATAKFGLLGFTRSLAAEQSRRGLKVFSVSPDFMDTSLTAGWDRGLAEKLRGAAGDDALPEAVARRIADLIEDPAVKGCGEDYAMHGTRHAV